MSAVGFRKVEAMKMIGITPSPVKRSVPKIEWHEPSSLFVEKSYQRNLSEKSITLIRRIVANWDWAHIKPPICARGEGRLFIIDGQHTAIAAASHGGIGKIPVMVIESISVKDRAMAFIGHNTDRIAMTPMQMYFAALAAGDPVAEAMAAACEKAGVTIRRFQPPNGVWGPGETVAVGAIRKLCERKGAAGGARVCKILIRAGRKPLTSIEIKAVEALFYHSVWRGKVDEYDLVTAIRSKTPREWIVAGERHRKEEKMPIFLAIAALWFRKSRKKEEAA